VEVHPHKAWGYSLDRFRIMYMCRLYLIYDELTLPVTSIMRLQWKVGNISRRTLHFGAAAIALGARTAVLRARSGWGRARHGRSLVQALIFFRLSASWF
jgi:hypothetical protein